MSGPNTKRDNRKQQVQAIDIAGRVPPHNTDAEAAVLAAVLLDGKQFDSVSFLRGDDFYSEAHKRVWEAIGEVSKKSQPVDIQTIAAWLRDRDWLQAIGGVSMLAELVDATPAVAHLEAHGRIVKEKARVRSLIETCQSIAAEGYGDYGEAQDFIDSAEVRVTAIGDIGQKSNERHAYDIMRDEFKRIERVQASGGIDHSAVPTGLSGVDAVLGGGHRPGELIVVAGRPGMGKSAYVVGVCERVAESGKGVLLFSLEMPTEQMGTRLAGHRARVDIRKLRVGDVRGEAWDRLVAACNELAQMPLWVDDTSALTIGAVRSIARRRAASLRRGGVASLGLIVVDYLQLMSGSGGEDNREQVISGVSRGLKSLAKELGVPVIALSQLNRAVETRPGKDKRPMLSDLRESGAIEQDADAVIFLFRPEYYITDKHSEEARKYAGYAEVIVAKQRNGPTEKVATTFIETYARFENRDASAWRANGDE